MDTTSNDLLKRILEVTDSPQSKRFYRKAIHSLGEGRVESELGELKYQIKTSQVNEPARYFTTLLKKQLSYGESADITPAKKSASKTHGDDIPVIKSYFSPTQCELFAELFPTKSKVLTIHEEDLLKYPYSPNRLHWCTIIGPEFFTLGTNKAKSDRVIVKFRTMDGKMNLVPMIRGKISPRSEERGILTVEHARILGALEHLWIKQQCRVTMTDTGVPDSCICIASLRDIAELLGWENFGGTEHTLLLNRIYDLKVSCYYLEFDKVEEYKLAGLSGRGFSFVSSVSVKNTGKKGPASETLLRVTFSPEYSSQLLLRRTVSRPLDFLRQKSQLAFLIRLYIEPILMSKKSGEQHAIELQRLVDLLWLPKAGWHKYKSLRRAQFEKTIQNLNGSSTSDGRKIHCRLEQGLNEDDLMFVSCISTI